MDIFKEALKEIRRYAFDGLNSWITDGTSEQSTEAKKVKAKFLKACELLDEMEELCSHEYYEDQEGNLRCRRCPKVWNPEK